MSAEAIFTLASIGYIFLGVGILVDHYFLLPSRIKEMVFTDSIYISEKTGVCLLCNQPMPSLALEEIESK